MLYSYFKNHAVRLLLLLSLILVASGCATRSEISDQSEILERNRIAYNQIVKANEAKEAKILKEKILSESEVTIALASQDYKTPKEIKKIKKKPVVYRPKIKITYNKNIEKWLDYFSIKDKKRFQRFLDRGEKYRPYIESVLQENGLPTELYYLAMIESGFVPYAKSHASAVGVWQFMRGTARDYGLSVNRYLDERKDYLQATEAAASFLSDLKRSLGSWELAIAAYNCGEGRMRKAIKRARTRDYWSLVKYKRLPRETANYVPKFMAAVVIGQNPTKFGFRAPKKKNLETLTRVKVPGGVSLKQISKVTGLRSKRLKNNNLHLNWGYTPSNKRSYEIWASQKNASVIKSKYKSLAKLRRKNTLKLNRSLASAKRHRVRRGESLGRIASRYGVSVSYLKRMNGLKNNRIYPKQTLIVSSPSVAKVRVHKVRRGENLSLIASKYGRSVASLKRLNGLKKSQIYVGQKIRIHSESYKARTVVHRVKKGENLSHIAKMYAARIHSIKKTNRLKTSRITIGQRLKIPVTSLKNYTVKTGDNLMKIARNFGLRLSSLRSMNNLKTSKIYVGQTLKIIQ